MSPRDHICRRSANLLACCNKYYLCVGGVSLQPPPRPLLSFILLAMPLVALAHLLLPVEVLNGFSTISMDATQKANTHASIQGIQERIAHTTIIKQMQPYTKPWAQSRLAHMPSYM